jgi:putative nucleotidyltransferase with HDIG domain
MFTESLLGRVLADDVITSNGIVLVGQGTMITREHLQSFDKFGIEAMDIRVVANIVDEESVSPPKLTPAQSKLMDDTQEKIEDFVDFIRKREEIPMETLERHIVPYVEEICCETNFYAILAHLKEHDDYIYRHSLGVSILANHMAKWMKFSATDTQALITAALVYDIGMTLLPRELLNKRGLYTVEEMKQIQQHTVQGYELLSKTSRLDPRIATVALQHHERMDGSGYPNRLHKDQISVEARIIGMLDVYMAMTSKRTYRSAHPVNVVLQLMQLEIAELFDSTYSVPFLHHMMRSQVGKEVRLTNGTVGRILYVSHSQPLRPLIMTDSSDLIDLQSLKDVHIQMILG